MNNRQDLTKFGIVALAALAIVGWVREPERHGSIDSPAVSPTRYTIVPEDEFATPEVDHEQVPYTEPAEAAAPAERSIRQPQRGEQIRQQAPARPIIKVPVVKAEADLAPPVAEPVKAPVQVPVTVPQDSGRHGGVEQARTRPEPARNPEPEPVREATVVRPDRSTPSVVTPRPDQQRSRGRSTAIIAGAGAAGAAIGAATGGGKGAVIGAITGAAGGYVYDRMSRGSYRNGGGSGQPSDTAGTDIANRFGTPAFQ